MESGVSGLAPPREWDAVVSTQCALQGERCVFVYLGPGRAIVEDGDAEDAVSCAVPALEGEIEPPYRALAIRRGGDTWAVGAVAIEVVELPADIDCEELMLTVTAEGERESLADGRPSFTGAHALASLAGERYDAFVARAARLEGTIWELTIDPL